jgi:hypothetical protein
MLMVQGVAPKVVMETLGHSQISLTLDTYSHVSLDIQKVAAGRWTNSSARRRGGQSGGQLGKTIDHDREKLTFSEGKW